jgi:hypothetical protein
MTRADVALGLQRALLGEVSASLRAVGFELRGRTVEVKFYFDIPPTDDDRETASTVITELTADLPPDARVDSTVSEMTGSERMPGGLVWVFRRRD